MNYTTSEENYIKAIFHLQALSGRVTTSMVAERLQTRPASVTDMMKKLAAKDLLNYERYYGFSLTAEGRKIALAVIRRHRLWEYFLAEKLDFGWEEVHQVAEELEHISSKKLIDRLDAFLGYPQFDPHGDPIPDARGRIAAMDQITLDRLPPGSMVSVSGVTNQSAAMLDELVEKQITIGTTVEIRKKSAFDGSLSIRVRGRNMLITEEMARCLLVKKIQNGTA